MHCLVRNYQNSCIISNLDKVENGGKIFYLIQNLFTKLLTLTESNTIHETKNHTISFVLIDLLDIDALSQKLYFS